LHVPVAPAGLDATLAPPDAAAPVFFLLLLDDIISVPELLDDAAAPGAAGSDGLLILVLLEASFPVLLAADAAVSVWAATPYHFLTPSCPLHAPLLEAADV
jgi:hypothetical protein